MDGFDVKKVIIDLITNYYLILQFYPTKDIIYSRPLIVDKNIDNNKVMISWKNLKQNNSGDDFYDSLSFIMVNSIRSLYGTFNLLIEYYTKPEKSLT